MKLMALAMALILSLTVILGPAGSFAQEGTTGPVTGLPIPRYVSLKSGEANVRRGPSTSHRIDWIFHRRHMPVQLTAEYGHWRKIRDMEGAEGWVHYALLNGTRYAIVTADEVELLDDPRPDGRVTARVEKDVVLGIRSCDGTWCELEVQKLRGWAPESALWGVDPGEIIE